MDAIREYELTPDRVESLKRAQKEAGPVAFSIPAHSGCSLPKSDIERRITIAEAAYNALQWRTCAETFMEMREQGITFLPFATGRTGLALAFQPTSPALLGTLLNYARDGLEKHAGDCAPYLLLALLKMEASQRAHALEWLALAKECPSINANALEFVESKLKSWIRTMDYKIARVLPRLANTTDFAKYKELSPNLDWTYLEHTSLAVLPQLFRQNHINYTSIHDDVDLMRLILILYECFSPSHFLQFDPPDPQTQSSFSALNENILAHMAKHLRLVDMARLGASCKLLSNWRYSDGVAVTFLERLNYPNPSTVKNAWSILTRTKVASNMIKYLPLLRSDPKHLFEIYEDYLMRWLPHTAGPGTSSLLAPYVEIAFSFLLINLVSHAHHSPATLGPLAHIVSWNPEFVSNLLFIIHSPPYLEHFNLVTFLISIFTHCIKNKTDLGDFVYAGLMANQVPVLLQLLPAARYALHVSSLQCLLMSRNHLDLSHAHFGDGNTSNELALPTSRALWHLRVHHFTSVAGFNERFAGYVVLEFGANGKVQGEGKIGKHVVTVKGTLQKSNLIKTLVLTRTNESFDGAKLVLRGASVRPPQGIFSGLASLLDESCDGDDDFSDESPPLANWILVRDEREVTTQLEEQISLDCAAAMPELGILLNPRKHSETHLQRLQEIDNTIGLLVMMESGAARSQWWSAANLSTSEMITLEKALLSMDPEILGKVSDSIKVWAKSKKLAKGRNETDAAFHHRCIVLHAKEKNMTRGPYESDSIFDKRYALLTACLHFTARLRATICRQLLAPLKTSIEVLKEWSATETPSRDLEARVSSHFASWHFRLRLCPLFVIIDKKFTIPELADYLSEMETLIRTRRKSTGLASGPILSTVNRSSEVEAITGFSPNNVAMVATIVVSIAVVSFAAYAFTKWVKRGSKRSE